MVVLIIGILAAVALPQYQKAVDKAKIGRLLSTGRSLANALDLYYLENGTGTSEWDNLSVDLSDGFYCKKNGALVSVSAGCSGESKRYNKDGVFTLWANGSIDITPYLKGEELGRNLKKSLAIIIYPHSYANLVEDENEKPLAGRIECWWGRSEYGKKLCSSMGKEDSSYSTSGESFFIE